MTKRLPVALFTMALFFVFEYIGLMFVFGALNAVDFGVRQYTEVGVGLFFVVLGVISLAVSLTCFLAASDAKAARSLRWLGGLKPSWH